MGELPRAVPVFIRCVDGCYLIGLDFETDVEAAKFADGLAEHSDRDGRRLFLKRRPTINADERGNCSGIN
jgi:hypothetical protein